MKHLVYLIAGLIVGVLITLGIQSSPSEGLLVEKESRYNFEESCTQLEASAKSLEWRTPAVHDMQKILAGAGLEITQNKIYEVCKPAHAFNIIIDDQNKLASPLLPCRIAVYEKADGKTYFAYTNMEQAGKLFKGEVQQAMNTVQTDIEKLLAPMVK